MTELYYRYEDGDGYIWLSTYEVLKHTPAGVRIKHWQDEKNGKFVHNETIKQWACPTIEAARVSYIARKKKQIKILSAQLERTKEYHDLAVTEQWSDIVYPIAQQA